MGGGFRLAGAVFGPEETGMSEASIEAARVPLLEREQVTAAAAALEFFPRFNSALRIPVTPLPEAR